jgi:hypothetical protein
MIRGARKKGFDQRSATDGTLVLNPRDPLPTAARFVAMRAASRIRTP